MAEYDHIRVEPISTALGAVIHGVDCKAELPDQVIDEIRFEVDFALIDAHLLGDEIITIGPGDLVHIPRNTVHGIRILESPCRFFTCKSPAGSGQLSEDYTDIPNVDELNRRLAEVA